MQGIYRDLYCPLSKSVLVWHEINQICKLRYIEKSLNYKYSQASIWFTLRGEHVNVNKFESKQI